MAPMRSPAVTDGSDAMHRSESTAGSEQPARFVLTAVLAALAALMLVIGATLGVLAYIPVARNGGDVACLLQSPSGSAIFDGPSPESVTAEGTWRLVPLGLECRYTDPNSGRQLVNEPNVTPSLLLATAITLTLLSAGLALRPLLMRRHDQ